jgi:adenylate cyclase
MTAAMTCRTCGGEPRAGARFCDACGAPIESTQSPAEYKQVTVLFADVVRSMDIASTEGPERLREIMADLLDRSAAIVKRYGGTLSQFTGDGIMAVFGAPITLEDHAFRACMAALDIQNEVGTTLKLRIGLNSGQVIAGEIGSSTAGYTTIGHHVGMAQRMESIAPPGGVMLSGSTARLVENTVGLSEPELAHIKGADEPVRVRRLLSAGGRKPNRRGESKLIGRSWELSTVTGILDEATTGGGGCVVNIVGSPGIGKSRLVREATAIAAGRGLPVYTTYCESHATDVPFRVITRFLRAVMGIDELDRDAARLLAHDQFPDANPDDLVLLDDLLGIRDAAVALPDVAADARRRRLTALINAASLARDQPGVYVVEDAHWIDEASESLLAGFLAVIAHIPALMLITNRPEYNGALSRVPDSQAVSLRPLSDMQSSTLTTELLGSNPSVADLASQLSARAAGNPFFLEEMVRDLAERGVLHGDFGAYRLDGGIGDASVPATLQATIGARIDRLSSVAKQTLNAAAVIGSRFDTDLLSGLVPTVDVESLIEAQLVEQVRFTPRAEYGFRHPLIRTVAYESQLKSDRAQLHRRLAETIQSRGAADENAALIAEHLEAAGDLRAAFDFHMRAGSWLTNRDIDAAQTSWQRARQVADRLPDDDPDRAQMRIGPRTLLAGTAWRVGGMSSDPGFNELSELCTATRDQRSLAIGMTGLVIAKNMNAHYREAADLGTELVRLLDDIGDPILTVALSFAAIVAKNETAEMAEMLRLADRVIELADGDLTKGNLLVGSPLASAFAARANARWCLGMPGWRADVQQAIAWSRGMDATTLSGTVWYTYLFAIPYGVLVSNDVVLRHSAEALAVAEQSGDDLALDLAQTARGVILLHTDGADHQTGLDLLEKTRQRAISERFALPPLAIANIHFAREKLRSGDLDRAIELSSSILDELFKTGSAIWTPLTASVLVDALLQRGSGSDLATAHAVVDRMSSAPTTPGFVLNEVMLLRVRVLLARAQGDDTGYKELRNRYRKRANELGFEGHMAWAEAMP